MSPEMKTMLEGLATLLEANDATIFETIEDGIHVQIGSEMQQAGSDAVEIRKVLEKEGEA